MCAQYLSRLVTVNCGNNKWVVAQEGALSNMPVIDVVACLYAVGGLAVSW